MRRSRIYRMIGPSKRRLNRRRRRRERECRIRLRRSIKRRDELAAMKEGMHDAALAGSRRHH